MKQSSQLEFESSEFRTPEEDEDTNSGTYGRALAQWLSAQLRARGLPAKSIVAGDLGWCVPVGSFPHSLYVACARTEEKPNHWRVFAFEEAGVLTRFLGRDKSTESLASLLAAVKQVLEENPAIHNLHEKGEKPRGPVNSIVGRHLRHREEISTAIRIATAIRMARVSFFALGALAFFEGWLSLDAGDTVDATVAGGLGLACILFAALANRRWLRVFVADDY